MSSLIRNSSAFLVLLTLTSAVLADDVTPDGPIETPKELSVAPLDHVEYPPTRPEWVNRTVDIDKESVSIVVVSGPSDSPEESAEELKLMQRAAVSTFLSRWSESGGQYDFYPITDDEIERELVVRRYEGEVLQGDTTRYEHAVELMFTDQRREEITAAWTNLEVRDRLGALGVLAFLGMTMLVCSSVVVGMFSRRAERRDQMGMSA